MDDRKKLKPGDVFNKTYLKTNDSEIWNNCNRFQTCILKEISNNGQWVFKEFWNESSKNRNQEYPFLSTDIYWNPNTEYALNNTFIQKINNPETEGFKKCKHYLMDNK